MDIEERLNALEQKLQGLVAEKDTKNKEPEPKDDDELSDLLLKKISVPTESKVGIDLNGHKTAGF